MNQWYALGNELRGPYKPLTSQCMNHAQAMPYAVYMFVLYAKQGSVKLSKMLMKSMHSPHRLPHQTGIGRRTAETSNMV